MANQSVLELAVGTGKWDAGLKKAKQSLDNFTQANGGLQQALDKESQKMSQFVQMMGKMDSTAKTAKGQMNDYKSTIEQLTMQYNRMTDAQKQSIGQDYLNAIDQMKQKYQAVNEEIQEMNRSLNGSTSSGGSGGSGLFGGDKLNGMLQVFGGNVMTKAASMAANFAVELGDAVKQGIELAKQGEGIRIAFERLGRGDLLDGLREATHGTVTDLELMKAAVKFNDFNLPLDQLGTMLAFAQQKAKDTGQSVDYMVESITNGLGRQSKPILDNLGISAKEIEERMKSTGDFTKAVGEIIRDKMKAAGDYIETAADRATQADVKLKNAMEDLGRTFEPLTSASDSLWNSIKVGALNALNTAVKPLIQALAEAGALGQGARSTAGFKNLGGNTKVDRMIGRLGNGKSAGAYSIYQQQLGEFDKYINNKRFQIAAYGGDNSSIAQSAKAKLQTELDGALKMREEYVKRAQELHNQVPSPFEPASTSAVGGGGKGGKTTKEFDISKIAFNAPKVDPEKMIAPPSVWEQYAEGIRGTFDAIGDEMTNLTEWTKNFDPYKQNIDDMTKKLNQEKMAFQMAGQAATSFGAALAGIEDPATKAAGTVIQAIANIALGFGSAVAQASSMGPYAWIAYVAAAMGAMATAVSTVHSLTGYAEGGIVKGDSYSGDNLYGPGFGINAGELVLSVAQQNALANTLTRQSEGGGMMQARVSGENIYLALNNYLKRTGQGELLTWG